MKTEKVLVEEKRFTVVQLVEKLEELIEEDVITGQEVVITSSIEGGKDKSYYEHLDIKNMSDNGDKYLLIE